MRADFLDYTSVLRLAFEFLHGRDKLKNLKFREHRKLVGMTFPFPDLVFAADAVPVFPVRMHTFPESPIYRLVNLSTRTSGWGVFTGILNLLQGLKPVRDFTDDIITGIITNLNQTYNDLADLAVERGVSSDFCYGIKGMQGQFMTKGHNLDLSLNFTIRCSSFAKHYEQLETMVPRAHWIELPVHSARERADPPFFGVIVEFMKSEVERLVAVLEEVTGNSITQHRLRETARLTNACREIIQWITFDAGHRRALPCRPHAFSEILILLTYAFIDCCSDLPRFHEILRELKRETTNRLHDDHAVSIVDKKRVYYAPAFGGFEPEVQEYVYQLGGVLYFADWDAWNFLAPVETRGDMIENYARHYLGLIQSVGADWSEMVQSYARTARRLAPDGVLFNQVFGCRMMTVGFHEFKQAMHALDLPVTLLNFNAIGENLGQTRTRVEAFMEML